MSTGARADAGLVDRDPRIAGLGLVLDDMALSDLIGEPVAVTRLRYKPGSSVAATWSSRTGSARGWIGAYTDIAKVDKAVVAASRTGASSIRVPELRVVVAEATGDRALSRTIARLQGRHPGLLGCADLIRHNPLRRQVWRTYEAGREVALRIVAHGHGHGGHRDAVRELEGAGVPVLVPEAIDGIPDAELVPWWGEGDLSSVPGLETGRAAGGAVARLHAAPPPRPRAATEIAPALEAVADIAPALRRRAVALRRALPSAPRGSAPVMLHGDLSPDQLLVGDGDIRLIDFDRHLTGPPERDLGSFLAAAHLGNLDLLRTPFLEGYARAGGRWDDRALVVWEALSLLARITEPFRNRAHDWPDRTRHILDRAEEVLLP